MRTSHAFASRTAQLHGDIDLTLPFSVLRVGKHAVATASYPIRFSFFNNFHQPRSFTTFHSIMNSTAGRHRGGRISVTQSNLTKGLARGHWQFCELRHTFSCTMFILIWPDMEYPFSFACHFTSLASGQNRGGREFCLGIVQRAPSSYFPFLSSL